MDRPKPFKIICRECEAAARSAKPETRFCSQACRNSFTNRRRDRGAVMYDLFMACRYQRGFAKLRGLWGLLCRVAEDFKNQDDRDGRQSWVDYDEQAADGRFTKYAYTAKMRC